MPSSRPPYPPEFRWRAPLQAELRLDHDIQVRRKRVARLLRAAGLVGCQRRRRRG